MDNFFVACDVTETARTSALTLYNQIYNWTVTNTKTMEDPLVLAQKWVQTNLTSQNLTKFGLQFILDEYPVWPHGVLPSSVPTLELFTFNLPLGTTTYPYAQLTTDLFPQATGCNGFAPVNGSQILDVYLQYLAAVQNGNDYILNSFNTDQYPNYSPFYGNVSSWYNNVLLPNAAAMQNHYGVNVYRFPVPSLPTINIGSQPTYQMYSIGSCTIDSLDVSVSPVLLEVFTGTDVTHNTSAIIVIGNGLMVNTGSLTYNIPCNMGSDVADVSIFFRITTTSPGFSSPPAQSTYTQLTAPACSAAAAMSIGLFAYAAVIVVFAFSSAEC